MATNKPLILSVYGGQSKIALNTLKLSYLPPCSRLCFPPRGTAACGIHVEGCMISQGDFGHVQVLNITASWGAN